jgi:chromate transporter
VPPPAGRRAEVFRAALRLGLTCFGGPVAHIGYFERAYVERHRWLTAGQFSALVALCQALPGPASSQLGFLIGLERAGLAGALAAWLGFTLPSALVLYAGARLAAHLEGARALAVVHGLQLAAVAVVAQAVWVMARRLLRDAPTIVFAAAAAVVLLALGGAAMQLAVLAGGALGGALLCRRAPLQGAALALPVSRPLALSALGVFALLFGLLPLAAASSPHGYLGLAWVFYRAGALVFGGGHVVLPLLRDMLVPQGWISDSGFLTGYGLAQAVPGPLFALAAYLGGANAWLPAPALAAALALVSLFLPGLLLALAGASLWGALTGQRTLAAALTGVNAAVVGILAAALYDPVWRAAVHGVGDALVAAAALVLLAAARAPPVAVVALCAGASLLRLLV